VHSSYTRGHNYKLFPAYCRVDTSKYFFANRVIASWNSLPATTEQFNSLAAFKLFIKTADWSDFVTLGF